MSGSDSKPIFLPAFFTLSCLLFLIQHRCTMIHRFTNCLANIMSFCPDFSSVTSSLGLMFLPSLHLQTAGWVLLVKTTGLQVGVPACSWSPTSAGPALLPPILSAPGQFFLPFLEWLFQSFSTTFLREPLHRFPHSHLVHSLPIL